MFGRDECSPTGHYALRGIGLGGTLGKGRVVGARRDRFGWTHQADRYSVTPQVLITAAGALHHLLSLAPGVQGARQIRRGGAL